MTEERADVGRGITLAYDILGPDDGTPLVLVAGLAQQLHTWPAGFCDRLTDHGLRVLRFDNRDCGHSTHVRLKPPRPTQFVTRHFAPHQYRLADMAEDTLGLLDAIGWPAAHLVGVSMGGMIAQTVAARNPEHVRSLTSIMSTTGARRVGRSAPSTWLRMAATPARTEDAFVKSAVRMFKHIGSSGYPFDEEMIRTAARTSWERDPQAVAGTSRQLAAILASGDRTREVASIRVPTLVVHGDRDRMINPSGGAATARAIPGARELTLTGMGHDLPAGLWSELAEAIADHVHAAAEAAR